MLADILVLGMGAVGVAVLAALQWYLSGRALIVAHTSQELLDLFANRVPLPDEHLVPPFEGVKPGDLHPLDNSISVAEVKHGISCAMADGSRRKVPYVRGDRDAGVFIQVRWGSLRPATAERNAVGSTGLD